MVVQYMYTLDSLADKNSREGIIAMREILLEQGHTFPVDDLNKKLDKIEVKSEVSSQASRAYLKHRTPYEYDTYSFVISESDAIISESSISNSTTGISIGIALSMGKPCLILVNNPNTVEKSAPSVVKNFNHPLLQYKEYSTLEELQKIVLEFLESINHRVRVRFNLVMDQNHDNYLTWAASQYDISKTEVITSSITEKAERDERYQDQRRKILEKSFPKSEDQCLEK